MQLCLLFSLSFFCDLLENNAYLKAKEFRASQTEFERLFLRKVDAQKIFPLSTTGIQASLLCLSKYLPNLLYFIFKHLQDKPNR